MNKNYNYKRQDESEKNAALQSKGNNIGINFYMLKIYVRDYSLDVPFYCTFDFCIIA